MSIPAIDPELAVSVAFRSAVAALAVGFLEQLTVFQRAFGPRGPFSCAVAAAVRTSRMPGLCHDSGMRVLLLLGSVAGVAGAILGPIDLWGRLAGALVFACVVCSKWRRVSGSDGAEQMAMLVIFAALVALLPGIDALSLELAVFFIAGQTILSYLTAGVAKAISPTWRKGEAVTLIMGSESHGRPAIASFFDSHTGVARLLSRAAVVFECAFALILIATPEMAAVLVVLGTAFHAACAVAMGLNTFLLVFPGTYACVIYAAERTSPFW